MRIFDHEATRIHGTVQIELEGGGLALLEVDIDVSGPGYMSVEPRYPGYDARDPRLPTIPKSHRFWLETPKAAPGLLDDQGSMFRLRVPTS